jgi:endonuclease-3
VVLLQRIISKLLGHYGPPSPPISIDPFELILFENIAYLVTDERRHAAFDLLRQTIGTRPHELLAAPTDALLRVTTLGGAQPERRAARLREIALIAIDDFAGDLTTALKLPLPSARQALKKFPSIGDPGAEKILLFTRAYPVLGLESNGLRVLVRLGFGEEKKNYSSTYKSVQNAIKDELGADYDWLIRAHTLLRTHGKELCKTNRPLCEECPVRTSCAYFLAHGK